MKLSSIAGAVVAIIGLAGPAAAQTIQTFEDAPPCDNVTPNVGAYGFAFYGSTWTCYSFDQDPYNPHSGTNRVYSDDFTTPITLFSNQVFDGAWFAGDGSTVMFKLFLGGSNVANSGSLTTTSTPTFLASGYSGLVDEIDVVTNSPDHFIMDDVTFNTPLTSSTPEPGSIILVASGLAGLAAKRFRRKA